MGVQFMFFHKTWWSNTYFNSIWTSEPTLKQWFRNVIVRTQKFEYFCIKIIYVFLFTWIGSQQIMKVTMTITTILVTRFFPRTLSALRVPPGALWLQRRLRIMKYNTKITANGIKYIVVMNPICNILKNT